MIAPQLLLLVLFSLVGVIAGLFQMHEHHTCRYCGSSITRGLARCPHCLCRLD